jgi:hypothetical protein
MSLLRQAFCSLLLGFSLCLPWSASAQIIPWLYEEVLEDVRQSGAKPDWYVDAQGDLHLSYWNANTDQLVYAFRNQGDPEWTFESIPDNGTFGYVSALLVDEQDVVHLAYHHDDNGRATLRYAERATNGTWTIESLRDSIDVGLYGPDLSFPSYVWPSIDIFLQPDGEPGILYFDGVRGNIQFCPVFAIRNSYFGYELDLNVIFRSAGDWLDVAFPDLPYLGSVTCINRGERFGEFCQMLTRSDGSYLTLVPGMHNSDLILFRSNGSSLVQWQPTKVDSVSNYLGGPGFFESFSYLDVTLQGDSLLHAVYQVTEHYGFENRDNRPNREALIYTRIHLDSVDSIGNTYTPYRYRFPEPSQPRFYPTVALVGDSGVAITYYQRNSEHVIQEVSSDRGLSWSAPDTLFDLNTNTPLHSEVVGDSLKVLVYDAGADLLRMATRPVDSLGQWQRDMVTRSEANGAALASAVRRVSGQDERYVVFTEGISDALRFGQDLGNGWEFEDILPMGNPVSELDLGLDGTGQPHVAYLTEGQNRLRYATREGGLWTTEAVPDSGRASQVSLDMRDDQVHLAFYDPQAGSLKYASLIAGSWQVAVIDSSGPLVGRYPSLAVDAEGGINVAYVDGAANRIKFATQDGSGNWNQYFVSDPQAFVINAVDLRMTAADQPEPIIAFKDALTDSVLVAEPGLDGVVGEWVFSFMTTPQISLSGNPLDMILDQRDRPWILYNYPTTLRELRLARRGSDNQWYQNSVLSNTAQIAEIFDFHLLGEDFYVIGRQNEPGNTGLGLLFSPQGLTVPIHAVEQGGGLTLYPNPARERVRIDWEQIQPGATHLELYDPQGRLLWRQQEGHRPSGAQNTWLDLADYAPGLYLCVLRTPAGSLSQRLLKLPQ